MKDDSMKHHLANMIELGSILSQIFLSWFSLIAQKIFLNYFSGPYKNQASSVYLGMLLGKQTSILQASFCLFVANAVISCSWKIGRNGPFVSFIFRLQFAEDSKGQSVTKVRTKFFGLIPLIRLTRPKTQGRTSDESLNDVFKADMFCGSILSTKLSEYFPAEQEKLAANFQLLRLFRLQLTIQSSSSNLQPNDLGPAPVKLIFMKFYLLKLEGKSNVLPIFKYTLKQPGEGSINFYTVRVLFLTSGGEGITEVLMEARRRTRRRTFILFWKRLQNYSNLVANILFYETQQKYQVRISISILKPYKCRPLPNQKWLTHWADQC